MTDNAIHQPTEHVMGQIEHRIALAIHAQRIPRDLELRRALREARESRQLPASGPHPVRRVLGHSLVAAGQWLAADPPPRRPARTD